MTKFDKVIIIGTIFIFLSIILSSLLKNIVGGIFISLLLTILIAILGIHYLNRKENKSYQNTLSMQNNLSIYGLEYQQNLLFNAVPPYFTPQKIKGFVTLKRNLEKIVLYSCYKFGGASLEDISKCYRFLVDKNLESCYVLTQMPNRTILTFTQSLDKKIIFIQPKKHHDYLYRHNIELPQIKRKRNKRIPIKELIKQTFTKKRARYFILACLSLCLFAIISPFKIFYFVMASILLIAGIICVFSPN